jgi:hypothetical protein
MNEGGIRDGMRASIPRVPVQRQIEAEHNVESRKREGGQDHRMGPMVSVIPTGLEIFVARQTPSLSRENRFFIRQEPTVGKIAGALEFPKKTFLYLMANAGISDINLGKIYA